MASCLRLEPEHRRGGHQNRSAEKARSRCIGGRALRQTLRPAGYCRNSARCWSGISPVRHNARKQTDRFAAINSLWPLERRPRGRRRRRSRRLSSCHALYWGSKSAEAPWSSGGRKRRHWQRAPSTPRLASISIEHSRHCRHRSARPHGDALELLVRRRRGCRGFTGDLDHQPGRLHVDLGAVARQIVDRRCCPAGRAKIADLVEIGHKIIRSGIRAAAIVVSWIRVRISCPCDRAGGTRQRRFALQRRQPVKHAGQRRRGYRLQCREEYRPGVWVVLGGGKAAGQHIELPGQRLFAEYLLGLVIDIDHRQGDAHFKICYVSSSGSAASLSKKKATSPERIAALSGEGRQRRQEVRLGSGWSHSSAYPRVSLVLICHVKKQLTGAIDLGIGQGLHQRRDLLGAQPWYKS